MHLFKSLMGDTAIYGVSSIIGRLLNYFLVPLYTGVFLLEEYGVVTQFYAFSAFLMVVYQLGMETTYFRFAKDGKEREIFTYAFGIILILGLVFSSLLIIFSVEISQVLQVEGHQNILAYLAGILLIDAMACLPFARLRWQNKAKKFAFIKLAGIFLNIGLNLYFLLLLPFLINNPEFNWLSIPAEHWFDSGRLVEYVFLANILSNAVMLLLLLPSMAIQRVRWETSFLSHLLAYSLPIVFLGLAGATNEMLSRTLLPYWLPEGFYPGISATGALGILGASYKLAVFMTLAIQAFRYAAEPFYFAQSKEKDSKETFSKVMSGFVVVTGLILFAVSLNLNWIADLFLRSEEYKQGLVIVPVLLLAHLFLGIFYNLSLWYKLTDRTLYGTYLALGGATLTVVLNYFLIPIFGYEGSAWATLMVYFSMAAASYWLGRKFYPVPYQVRKDLLVLLLFFVGSYAAVWLTKQLPFTWFWQVFITGAVFLGVAIQEGFIKWKR